MSVVIDDNALAFGPNDTLATAQPVHLPASLWGNHNSNDILSDPVFRGPVELAHEISAVLSWPTATTNVAITFPSAAGEGVTFLHTSRPAAESPYLNTALCLYDQFLNALNEAGAFPHEKKKLYSIFPVLAEIKSVYKNQENSANTLMLGKTEFGLSEYVTIYTKDLRKKFDAILDHIDTHNFVSAEADFLSIIENLPTIEEPFHGYTPVSHPVQRLRIQAAFHDIAEEYSLNYPIFKLIYEEVRLNADIGSENHQPPRNIFDDQSVSGGFFGNDHFAAYPVSDLETSAQARRVELYRNKAQEIGHLPKEPSQEKPVVRNINDKNSSAFSELEINDLLELADGISNALSDEALSSEEHPNVDGPAVNTAIRLYEEFLETLTSEDCDVDSSVIELLYEAYPSLNTARVLLEQRAEKDTRIRINGEEISFDAYLKNYNKETSLALNDAAELLESGQNALALDTITRLLAALPNRQNNLHTPEQRIIINNTFARIASRVERQSSKFTQVLTTARNIEIERAVEEQAILNGATSSSFSSSFFTGSLYTIAPTLLVSAEQNLVQINAMLGRNNEKRAKAELKLHLNNIELLAACCTDAQAGKNLRKAQQDLVIAASRNNAAFSALLTAELKRRKEPVDKKQGFSCSSFDGTFQDVIGPILKGVDADLAEIRTALNAETVDEKYVTGRIQEFLSERNYILSSVNNAEQRRELTRAIDYLIKTASSPSIGMEATPELRTRIQDELKTGRYNDAVLGAELRPSLLKRALSVFHAPKSNASVKDFKMHVLRSFEEILTLCEKDNLWEAKQKHSELKAFVNNTNRDLGDTAGAVLSEYLSDLEASFIKAPPGRTQEAKAASHNKKVVLATPDIDTVLNYDSNISEQFNACSVSRATLLNAFYEASVRVKKEASIPLSAYNEEIYASPPHSMTSNEVGAPPSLSQRFNEALRSEISKVMPKKKPFSIGAAFSKVATLLPFKGANNAPKNDLPTQALTDKGGAWKKLKGILGGPKKKRRKIQPGSRSIVSYPDLN